MATTKDLAKILTDLDAAKYASIIERAANNGYHDFKFDAIEGHPEYGDCICPKLQLVKDLEAFPELQYISNAVIAGDYDEQSDDEDTEMLRRCLLKDGAQDAFFELFNYKVPTKEERDEYAKKQVRYN